MQPICMCNQLNQQHNCGIGFVIEKTLANNHVDEGIDVGDVDLAVAVHVTCRQ